MRDAPTTASTLDSAEVGKQASPLHKPGVHWWLKPFQANTSRSTVTFPSTGIWVPLYEGLTACSLLSINWQSTYCRPSTTLSLTVYILAVSESQHSLCPVIFMIKEQGKKTADGSEKADKPGSVWQVVLQLGCLPSFWVKILPEKKKKKIFERTVEVSFMKT